MGKGGGPGHFFWERREGSTCHRRFPFRPRELLLVSPRSCSAEHSARPQRRPTPCSALPPVSPLPRPSSTGHARGDSTAIAPLPRCGTAASRAASPGPRPPPPGSSPWPQYPLICLLISIPVGSLPPFPHRGEKKTQEFDGDRRGCS